MIEIIYDMWFVSNDLFNEPIDTPLSIFNEVIGARNPADLFFLSAPYERLKLARRLLFDSCSSIKYDYQEQYPENPTHELNTQFNTLKHGKTTVSRGMIDDILNQETGIDLALTNIGKADGNIMKSLRRIPKMASLEKHLIRKRDEIIEGNKASSSILDNEIKSLIKETKNDHTFSLVNVDSRESLRNRLNVATYILELIEFYNRFNSLFFLQLANQALNNNFIDRERLDDIKSLIENEGFLKYGENGETSYTLLDLIEEYFDEFDINDRVNTIRQIFEAASKKVGELLLMGEQLNNEIENLKVTIHGRSYKPQIIEKNYSLTESNPYRSERRMARYS